MSSEEHSAGDLREDTSEVQQDENTVTESSNVSTPCDTETSSVQTMAIEEQHHHVSTITVNDAVNNSEHAISVSIGAPKATAVVDNSSASTHSLHIQLTNTPSVGSQATPPPPPLPAAPPPTILPTDLPSPQPTIEIPTIETQSPSPTDEKRMSFGSEAVQQQLVNGDADGNSSEFTIQQSPDNGEQKVEKIALLRMILDNGLETSLVFSKIIF